MNYDVDAIIRAYPNAVSVSSKYGAFDVDGNKIIIDQKLVDAASSELNAERIYDRYKYDREVEYPPLKEFADAMYWSSKGDNTKLNEYYSKCEAVKNKYPKPS